MTFPVCDKRLMFLRSLHFFACTSFWRAIIVTSSKSLGHSPVKYIFSGVQTTSLPRGVQVSSAASYRLL
uniref:Putative secreted protein n=1 Tax=Xenopsylla cheopis TaxID=163159 RepID=A0A6M2DUJ1_XENCH